MKKKKKKTAQPRSATRTSPSVAGGRATLLLLEAACSFLIYTKRSRAEPGLEGRTERRIGSGQWLIQHRRIG